MEIVRRKTNAVRVGSRTIGGTAPITVQSMANTDTLDLAASLAQARAFEAAGCDILRFAAPTVAAAKTFAFLKENGITMPLVADIHFDWRIAIACAEAGADKIRINPGNIGGADRVKAVVDACRTRGLPIRIGVNSGSLEKSILARHGAPTPEALAESALYHASLLERFDFHDIVLSVKASSPAAMIAANRILAERTDYPLHLGVTEAGTAERGTLKSAIGIGSLLCDGIGDTVRVSLTADPVREVAAARAILEAAGVAEQGIDLVSCPTCGRTRIDLISLAEEFERRAKQEITCERKLKVAIMGCVVNGPGEAREADIGIAGGDGEAVLFRHGEIIDRVPEDRVIDRLIDEINRMA